MTDWCPRANEIFLDALDIVAPEERRLFLDKACGGDGALRARVELLLRAGERAGGFLQAPAPGAPFHANVLPPRETPGAVIGPYELREQLGEGGFGVVYLAEQQRPVRRLVALKVIKPGMDTREVIARFEAERQALVLMDHPNI